jgi:membrane associated rhomboid family serine protease
VDPTPTPDATLDKPEPLVLGLTTFTPVRPRVMAVGAVVCAGLGLLVVAQIFARLALGSEVDLPSLVSAALLLGGTLTFITLGVMSWRAQKKPPGAVVLDDVTVLLPSSWGRPPRKVDLSALTSIELRARAGEPFLVLATQHRMWFLGGVHFERGERAVVELFEALRRNVKALDGGPAQLKAMEERLDALAFALSRRPIVSLLVVTALGIAYLFEVERGVPLQTWGLVDLGALVPSLVKAGEAWRLAASQLLHVSAWHLLINSVSLLFVGAIVERLIGRMRTVIVLLGAGLLGALASVFISAPVMSVGASASACALFGAAAIIRARFGGQVPAGLRQSATWWVTLALGAGLVPLAQPQVDAVGLVVGAVAGAGLTLALVPRDLRPGMPPPSGLLLQLGAASLLAVLVGSAGVAFSTPPRPAEAQIAALLTAESEQERSRATRVLPLAKALAFSEGPAKAEINAGLDAIAKLSADEAERSDVLKARAALTYRLGQPAEAVALQHRALTEVKLTPREASLMARFAREADARPVFVFGDAAQVPIHTAAGRPLTLEFEAPVDGVFVLAAIEAGKSGKPGLAVARVPGPVEGKIEVQMPKRPGVALPGYATLIPLVVGVGDCHCDAPSVRFVAHDPLVDKLPR